MGIFRFLLIFAAAMGIPHGSVLGESSHQSIDDTLAALVPKKKTWIHVQIAKTLDAFENKQYLTASSRAATLKNVPDIEDFSLIYQAKSSFERAREALKKNKNQKAVDDSKQAIHHSSKLIERLPDSPLKSTAGRILANSEMILGRALARKKKWKESQVYLKNAFSRLRGKKKLPWIQSRAIQSYVRGCKSLKNKKDCLSYSLELAKAYPDRSIERKLIYTALPMLESRVSQKTRSWKKVYRKYPSPDKDALAYRKAVEVYLDGDLSESIELFDAFVQEYPKSKLVSRSFFWAARAYAKKGDSDKAQALFKKVVTISPLSFYGLAASMKLGVQLQDYIDAALPMANSDIQFLPLPDSVHLRKSQLILSSGRFDGASEWLDAIRPRAAQPDESLVYLATLNHRAGNYLNSFRYLSLLLDRGNRPIVSSHGLRMIFPRVHWRKIQEVAQKREVDPYLVMSLIKQESAFEKSIVSPSGAIGLMQLMPFTALDMDPKVKMENLIEPSKNIELGVGYLKRVLRKFDGNIAQALAGYNAGPARVQDWKKEIKPEWDLIDFVEWIPYPETRGYVSSIMRNYYWYRYLNSGERLMNLSYFEGEKPILEKIASGASPNGL